MGLSTGQSLTDAMRQILWLAAGVGNRADGLLLELDGHDKLGDAGR